MLDTAYKKLLTQIVKKEMVILGPSIAVYKARKVKGLTVSNNGNVIHAIGNYQKLTTDLINQYTKLSNNLVAKPLQKILSNYPEDQNTLAQQQENKKTYFL